MKRIMQEIWELRDDEGNGEMMKNEGNGSGDEQRITEVYEIGISSTTKVVIIRDEIEEDGSDCEEDEELSK